MNIKILLVIVGIITILGVAIGLLIGRNQVNPPSFTLFKESGSVFVKKPDNSNFQTITNDETTLPTGSSIKTGEGIAHALLPDNSSVSIDTNSIVQVSITKSQVSISQEVGNTWHRVQKLAGHNYTVETPTTVATVRGTEFGVMVESDETGGTQVMVTENTVEVAKITRKNGKKSITEKQMVVSGRMAILQRINKVETMSVQDMPDEMRNSRWVKRNNEVQNMMKGGKPREILQDLRNRTQLKKIDQEYRDLLKSKTLTPTGQSNTDQNEPTIIPELNSTTNGILGAQVGDYLKNLGDVATACQQLSQIQTQDALSQLSTLGNTWGLSSVQVEQVKTILTAYIQACQDNIISPEELQKLQSLAG